MSALPSGVTSFDPMPYGYRRWNGSVWCDAWVDLYNRDLRRIQAHHGAGYDVRAMVDGLYSMAHSFDHS